MALGKYSRVDGRKSSSSYCSTVTLVVFVALCLVGVWMMTSSSVVPVQNADVASQEKKNQVKEQANESNESTVRNENNESTVSNENNESTVSNENNESNPKQFEDNPGDLPEDATKGDTNVNSAKEENNEPQENKNASEKTSEDAAVENEEEKLVKKEDETKFEDVSKTETENHEAQTEDGESKAKNKDSEAGDTTTDSTDDNSSMQQDSDEGSNEKKANLDENEKKSEENSNETKDGQNVDGQIEEKVDQNEDKESDQTSEKKKDGQAKDLASSEVFPSGAQSELLNETTTQTGAWATQATESKNEKEAQTPSKPNWKLCNVTAGPDYIPCLDNWQAIRSLRSTKHYEHRERHCPEEPPTCLVPLPEGYQRPIEWPTSREKIWYHNVPHTKLAQIKGHQNWVKVSGDYLTFPGGGTQFKNGALHYIDVIQQAIPDIAWGKRTRVVLDVGCGVASFGGFLFERDVLTMSFAPKDEHEAQVQFALERGIPAISAVMGTKRLQFPGRVFDVVHCARCRVPWHIEGGKLLLELNRVLRPGGFFIWSATPIYQKLPDDVAIWQAMKELTKSMCWEVVSITRDTVNGVGIAVYQKPTTNECYEKRTQNVPPVCQESDDPNAAWNVPLQACMHKIPVVETERGSKWPKQWPARVEQPPYWLLSSQVGVYGKAAPEDFTADYQHWKRVVAKSYLTGMGINWSSVRNVMDMKAIYGGFAAALRDLKVWVMNVVPIDSPDTLPIIYERGLFGMYHDWCESFSTYPRSYDLLHADHLFSKVKKRCNLVAVVAEVDRILRPEGKLIVRDKVEIINEVESLVKAMHWEVRLTYSKDKEGILCVQKTVWRPTEVETVAYAIA